MPKKVIMRVKTELYNFKEKSFDYAEVHIADYELFFFDCDVINRFSNIENCSFQKKINRTCKGRLLSNTSVLDRQHIYRL
jgi:hypothetical protein